MKLIRLFLLCVYCIVASSASAQLTINTVDPGPYTPGSTIAATFTIDPATCIPVGNVFRMYLSDATGNFTAPLTQIGEYNGFYSTFVNGTIPAGTPAGVGYRVRIVSSSTGLSTDSGPFIINPIFPPLEARIISNRTLPNSNSEAFGFCASQTGANANMILSNPLSASGVATATFTNELDQSSSTMVINPQVTFTPDQAHYTMFVKVLAPNGTVATKAYFIINNKTLTTLNTSGSNVVCLPGGALSYPIDINTIRENFPGDTYRLDWGDGDVNIYTFCDLKVGSIQHTYTTTSCGHTNVSGNTTVYNAFGINMQLVNPFCGDIGTPVSTTAKVVNITQNSFTGPAFGCTNSPVTFTNTSILGDDPNNTGPSCLPDQATFNWYVDGILMASGLSRNDPFSYAFPTNGNHTVTLESISSTPCQGAVFNQQICIQNPPQPNFTLAQTRVCTGTLIKPTNASIIDANCSTNNSYIWVVSPGVTFINGTDANSPEPEFNVTTTGIYEIVLLISTATCGTVASAPQQIIVDATPTATLSADIALCNLATYDFNPTTPGPTRTQLTGTPVELPTTYTWTITGGNYNFIGSDLHSRYPRIQFLDFATYTITVTHTNTCGTKSDTQIVSFIPAPIVDAGTYPAICNNTPTVTLNGSVTGANTGYTWTGGAGTFSPDNHTLNAVYTPTATERANGLVNLTLTATTALSAPCNSISAYATITIKPPVLVNSPNAKRICTGANVNYTPTSTTVGTTFNWTATGSTNATGYSASGSGAITDIITNTDPNIDATVTYTITPTGNGCVGNPFTLTVTVTPNPIVTPTAANLTICSEQTTNITLTSNLSNTKYTWTSTATGGVMGGSNNNTSSAVTTINDQLFNTGTAPGTVTYTITPISSNNCTGTPATITITVEPNPTAPNAGSDQSICNTSTYVLNGNTATVGTGKWTLTSGQLGITFDDDTNPTATVNGLQPGNTYIFRWTITGAASCAPKTDDVAITVNPVSVGGTTAGSTAVCAGNNSGQITLTGQVGSISRWESSIDGVTWTPITNTTASLTYTNLTTTTQFRAVIKSGSCAEANSTSTTITVNNPVVAANAGSDQELCNTAVVTLNGNNPSPDTGLWTLVSGQSGVTFDDATAATTNANGLVAGQTYIFRWTITGLAPCPPSVDEVAVKIDLPSDGGTTAGSATTCAGNNSGQITVANFVGNILRWESSTDGFTTINTIASTATSIPYLNLTTTTQYRAVVQNGVCGPAFSSVATISVNQGAVAANAGADQSLCNASSTTLAGNSPTPNTGQWTIISGPAGAVITDPTLYNTTVTGLVGGASYIFRWTVSGLAPCPASSDDVNVVNLPALIDNTISTPTTTNCNGQTITLTGSTPSGGNTSYTYIWESSTTGAAPWTTINGQTGRDLNVTLTASSYYRRIVNSGVCSTTSNSLNITVLPSIANNTIAADQTICLTNTPNPIIGSQPTGGDGANYTYAWEQSTDGVVWTVVSGAIARDYAPPAITQTTSYRRLVSSAACTGAQQHISVPVTITVNPNARAEYTYSQDVGCTPFTISAANIKAVSDPSRNNTYSWYANGVLIGSGINFPGYTISTYNTTVEIKLVVASSLNCFPAEFAHNFSTQQNIVASFTPSVTEGCGPLNVTFTNTTTAAVGNTYEWKINDVVVSTQTNLPPQTFQPDPSGKDKDYQVVLTVSSACGVDDFTSTIKVKGRPIPALTPSSNNGCSPFTVTFTNSTPGGANHSYTIDFGDGTAPQTYNFGDVISHTYTTSTVVVREVRMTAINDCATVVSDPIFITVSPNGITPLFFVNGPTRVCVGDVVTFVNNSSGASRFEYSFDDGTTNRISQTGIPESFTYQFTTPGIKRITMVASNYCATNSAFVDMEVLARPSGDFTADVLTGCTNLRVNFTSTTTGAASYRWDFGDGSPSSNDPNPTHVYANAAPGTYRVTLTITNNLNCSLTIVKDNYITIVAPPTVDFSISPAAVISIPDYTFKFTNESRNGAETYRWSFGDGDISTQKDPTHLYADTGKYVVTLRSYNQYGCVDSIQKTVKIIGVPGYTFVPNSFIPGSESLHLQKFMAVGSGMKSWKMTIFNKWGQVLWETTKLEDGKPVEGWDGTYKGVPQPQGIYFWKIDVELINGSEWKGMSLGKGPPKRTGEIYLIR